MLALSDQGETSTNLREEMEERLRATADFGWRYEDNPTMSGWHPKSEDWDPQVQIAVEVVMTSVNVLLEMVLRIAEVIDELRDSLDKE